MSLISPSHPNENRFCEMNPDVTYASCDAPQEKTDAEVELDEDGNEVRDSASSAHRKTSSSREDIGTDRGSACALSLF